LRIAEYQFGLLLRGGAPVWQSNTQSSTVEILAADDGRG
jgi:hypothetical protein